MANNAKSRPETHWQSGAGTVSSMVESLLSKKEFCDVMFRVGADVQDAAEEIPCHRALLAGRSPVFAMMFYGSLPETKGVVDVPDILAAHFHLMLKFVYSDDISVIEADNLSGMYAIADKYDIAPLKKYCADHVQNCVSMKMLGDFLRMKDLYQDEVIDGHCDSFIKANAWRLFQEEANYIGLSLEHLIYIWKNDTLPFSRRNLPEIDIYRGVVTWAKAQCEREGLVADISTNQRMVLGDAVDLFCFPRMTLSEFNSISKKGQNCLLTWEEVAQITMYMVNTDNATLPVGRPVTTRVTRSTGKESIRLSDGRVVEVEQKLLQAAIAGKYVIHFKPGLFGRASGTNC